MVSVTSTITSAGSPARTAARRIASADGASYRQYVFRLSADSWAVAAGLEPHDKRFIAQKNGFRIQILSYIKPVGDDP
jgi:hypothetical protein